MSETKFTPDQLATETERDLYATLASIAHKADEMATDPEQSNRGLWAGCRNEARAALSRARGEGEQS
jgi:hypothetical protein